jgi:hypothetical protein
MNATHRATRGAASVPFVAFVPSDKSETWDLSPNLRDRIHELREIFPVARGVI